VRVWDAKSGEQLMGLQGHTDSVNSVALSPDGHRIVSGSFDNSVRVWKATTGDQLRGQPGTGSSSKDTPAGSSRSHSRLMATKSSLHQCGCGRKKQARLRKLQLYTKLVTSVTWDAKQHGHTDSVSSVAFSVKNQIVSGSRDKSVRVWNAKGEQLKELRGHTHAVSSVAFSPDGHRIVSGSYDKSVRVWDAELHGHTASVTFPSGSWDQSTQVWDNMDHGASWEDGWILSGAEMLVWVPSTICNVLLCPHDMPISRNGSATISFTQRNLGTLWHECYTL